MRRFRQILLGAAMGALTGWLSGRVTFGLPEPWFRFLPGVIFGIGVALLRGFEMRPLRGKTVILLLGFLLISTTAYRVAMEVAMRLSEWIGREKDLWIPGLAAGVVGAAKLTAIWQLAKLSQKSWFAWVIVPILGALLGLLLQPAINGPETDDYLFRLFIPWQCGVAAALMAFPPPERKPG